MISNFVDIISYVRLYAVGAASFAIANAFNEMAISSFGSCNLDWRSDSRTYFIWWAHVKHSFMRYGHISTWYSTNTLEFSSHAGVQWGGLHYKPFKRTEEHI